MKHQKPHSPGKHGDHHHHNHHFHEHPKIKQRILDKKVSICSKDDIFNGVTNFDISKIWSPVKNIDFSSKHDVLIMNSDGKLLPMDEPYFENNKISENTFQIRSDGDYCYLLIGDEIGIMIDCGYGCGNIREYAEKIAGKPVKYVINTHYHFDHTANNSYFDAVFMSSESVNYATKPYNSFSGLNFPRDYPIIVVEDGYKINLGNREIEIIKFLYPNHTRGSIAILDEKNKLLFTGDEFLMPKRVELKYVTLEQFKESMEKIYKFRNKFEKVLTGPGEKTGNMIDDYYNAVINAVKGTPDPKKNEEGKKSAYKKPEVPDNGHIVYVRGSARKGDKTENSPEILLTGESKTYTYNGFTINYVIPK